MSITVTISAGTVAWYGAVVATVSIALAWYALWRDRARLKVSAHLDMEVLGAGSAQEEEPTYVCIHVANVGRRAVHLRSLPWFLVEGQKKCIALKGSWSPSATLEEGRSAMLLVPQKDLQRFVAKIKCVCVADETGKIWRGKVKGR